MGPAKPRTMGWRRIGVRPWYATVAWLLVGGIAVQVFLAGLGFMEHFRYFEWHTAFVHFLELLPLTLIVLALVGRGPRRTLWLPIVLFLLIGAQYGFINAHVGWVRALHVLNALAIFGTALGAAMSARTSGLNTAASVPSPVGPRAQA